MLVYVLFQQTDAGLLVNINNVCHSPYGIVHILIFSTNSLYDDANVFASIGWRHAYFFAPTDP